MHLWTLIHRSLVELALVIPPGPKQFISQWSMKGWKFAECGICGKGHMGSNRGCACREAVCIVFLPLNLSWCPLFLWKTQEELLSLSMYVCISPPICSQCVHIAVFILLCSIWMQQYVHIAVYWSSLPGYFPFLSVLWKTRASVAWEPVVSKQIAVRKLVGLKRESFSLWYSP